MRLLPAVDRAARDPPSTCHEGSRAGFVAGMTTAALDPARMTPSAGTSSRWSG